MLIYPGNPHPVCKVASPERMKQFSLPRAVLTRIVFLFVLVGGIAFVAARGNFTSRASNKPAITTGSGESAGKSPSSSSYAADLKAFTLSPPCTTNPIVVNNSDSGAGSLRQAIADACDASTITFNMAMVASPITLTTDTLVINKNLTITGPGSSLLTVQRSSAGGTPQFRIISIDSGTVSISGLTITNGNTPDGAPGGTIGSTATEGGGIRNAGSLTMSDVSVIGNRGGKGGNATNVPGDGGRAGGIYNIGSLLTMTNCTISGNSAGAGGTGGTGGGGRGGDGGGIFSQSGTMTLTNVTISNNTGGASTTTSGFGGMGGGIFNNVPSTASLTNCTVSGNSSGDATGPSSTNGFGGGLRNDGAMTVIGSTISSNTSHGPGGGVINEALFTLINSTISGNSAAFAGAFYNSGSVSFTNCTITNNSASTPGDEGVENAQANAKVRNTIIAGNGTKDVLGFFTSLGNNLIGKADTDGHNGFINGSNNDQAGGVATPLDPRLGPLANNGGPTQTHALLADSTAIDAGNNCVLNDSCSPALGSSLTTDQRGAGFNRAVDGNGDGTATVDIGAYEVQNLLVTNTNDSGAGSLRQAITDANVGADTNAINFQAGLTGTINLLTELPLLASSMKLNGPGASVLTVARSNAAVTNFSVFTIYSGPSNQNVWVTISGLTVTGGHSSSGAGIRNLGTLTISSCAIANNASTGDGAGITNGFGGAFVSLIVKNSTVSNNSAVQSGGGINNGAPLTIVNSTISGNRTDLHGGGIMTGSDSLTIINSTITNNRADFNDDTFGGGGGMSQSGGGTRILQNTIVAGNFHGTGSARSDVDLALGSTSSFSLIGDGTGMTGITNGSNGNQVGSSGAPIDPRLGPLAGNGGPTLTHALLSGSPAIDAGNNSVVTNPPFIGPPFTDQRGGSFNRIADGDGNSTANVDIGAYELQGILAIDKVTPPAGRVSGGQQIVLAGGFANLSTVTMGGAGASWIYTNGAGDTSMITVTTPAHAVGAVQIDLTPTSGSPYSKANAFAYLPTVFTDDTIMVGVTTSKAQHIIELRQTVDAMRAVAGLAPAPWTDGTLTPNSSIIKAIHIQELRTYLDDAATRLGYSTSPYTDASLTIGDTIKRIHIEELRQRIRTIAG